MQASGTSPWFDSLPARFGAWYSTIAGLWAPLLLLLGYRPYDLEFLALGGITVVPALLTAVASRWSSAFAALLAALTLFLFLDLYVIDVVDARIGAVDFILMAIPCWLLRTRIVTVLGAGVLAFTVSVALTAEPLEPGNWSTAPAARAGSLLPPVIHLILDEHCGTDCFPPEVMSEDERRIEQQVFVDRGFAVWSGVRSTAINTRPSLSAMMNPQSATRERLLTPHSPGFEFALTQNSYFERMLHAGYRIRVLQSSYLNYCPPVVAGAIECRAYPHNSAGVLRSLDLTLAERLRLLTGLVDWSIRHRYDTVLYRELLKTDLGARVARWRATESRRRLQPLVAEKQLARVTADLDSVRPGDLYVAHLLLPHHPYVFDRDCHVLPVEQWVDLDVPSPITSTSIRTDRYQRYKAQVICTDRMITTLLDGIAGRKSLRDAIIVMHGDHGSRIGPGMYARIGPGYEPGDHDKDFRSAFFVAKMPGLVPGTRVVTDLLLPDAFWSIMGPAARLDGE